MTKAYLLGALHDATERRLTFRISQKSERYVKLIAQGIHFLKGKAWTYREGKDRKVFIVEFSKTFLEKARIRSKREKIDYIRGYFDTEGGIAKQPSVRYYLYFAQKDREDLEQVRGYLTELGIVCGRIHNPSKHVDPNYWRFYISALSYKKFAKEIGSWHPEKASYLR